MNSFDNQKGFTLIEVLVAMVILTVGILSLYMMQISAIKTNSHALHLTTAATWNTDRIEQFVGMDVGKDEFKDGNALKDGYSVSWIVTLNAPIAGTRIVQVTVQDSSSTLSTPVVFQYIKNENI